MTKSRARVVEAREDFRLFVQRVHEGRYPCNHMIALIAKAHVKAFKEALHDMIERDLRGA